MPQLLTEIMVMDGPVYFYLNIQQIPPAGRVGSILMLSYSEFGSLFALSVKELLKYLGSTKS